MEKEIRRRLVRRQIQLKVSLDDRKGIERRIMNRRSVFDRRIKHSQVMNERRTGNNQRTAK